MLGAYVVVKDTQGTLTYDFRKLYPVNAQGLFGQEFSHLLPVVEEVYHADPEQLIPRLIKSRLKPTAFLQGPVTTEQKAVLRHAIESRLQRVLNQIPQGHLFLMGSDGYPAWKEVIVEQGQIRARFHFRRAEDGALRYFPLLNLGEEVLKPFKEESYPVTTKPGRILIGERLCTLHPELEIAKVKPFLAKPYLEVSPASEEVFMDKFVTGLLAKFPVKTDAFAVEEIHEEPVSQLWVTQDLHERYSLTLEHTYRGRPAQAQKRLVWRTNEGFVVCHRNKAIESLREAALVGLGLVSEDKRDFKLDGEALSGPAQLYRLLELLSEAKETLDLHGINFKSNELTQPYHLAVGQDASAWHEEGDWLDLQGFVYVGEYKLAFSRVLKAILEGSPAIRLPNDLLWVIPSAWFTRYQDLHLAVNETEQGMRIKRSLAPARAYASNIEPLLSAPIEVPEGVNATLRPYQVEGFQWIAEKFRRGQGAVLADDMGLGKTIQAITALQWLRESLSLPEGERVPPALVIAPTSLVYNWQLEIQRFCPEMKIRRHMGPERGKTIASFSFTDIILTTYGTTRSDIAWMQKFNFLAIVADEAQQFKNAQSATAKAVLALKGRVKLALSGTPIENRLTDLWPILTFANPKALPPYERFLNGIVKPIERDVQSPQTALLARIVKENVLRRTKEQVAKDLPPRTEHVIYTPMSEEQAKVYAKYKSAFRNEFVDSIRSSGYGRSKLMLLRGLTSLRQIANDPSLVDPSYEGNSGKHEQLAEFLKVATSEGHKILLFSQFVRHLERVRALPEVSSVPNFLLHGAMSPLERQRQVEAFNAQEGASIFLLSLKAGGVGLNLTCADYAILLDPWWNPASEMQAIDRTHRIGQTKPVFAYRFITQNSIEEKILKLQQRKKAMSDLFSADNLPQLSEAEALDLLEA